MPRCFLEAKQPFSIPQYMFRKFITLTRGFPGGSDSKESACNAGDWSLILGLGSFSGEGNGKPLQYSCLENPMAGYSPWGRKEVDMTEQHFHFHFTLIMA